MRRTTAVSPYDRLCWPEAQLEGALASGKHHRELATWFGAAEYRQLTTLARAAARRSTRARRGPTLYLLPGLMGSQLGWPRGRGLPPDLLWLDPQDVVTGRLLHLSWHRRPAPRPLGLIAHTYLALTLRLRAAGLRVVLHDYDWRADLATLAARLARQLAADAADELVLVGHSMGGVLARAALMHPSAPNGRIRRVIGLGTPHAGAIGAVQALQASYPAILRLAALDPLHDATMLSARLFRGFASLYQLLPDPSEGLNFFEPGVWPSAPDPHLLARAQRFRSSLAAPDERFSAIIGVGQRTVTGLQRYRGQYRYEVSSAGDGTVAVSSARLPGGANYSLRCEHSELPRQARVAAAVIELALTGRTRQLRAGASVRKGRCVYVTDAMLHRELETKICWESLNASERRRYLTRLNAPPALYRPRTAARSVR